MILLDQLVGYAKTVRRVGIQADRKPRAVSATTVA